MEWLLKLAYLSDICSKLNETCISLRGKELSIFQAQDIISVSRKLQFWSSKVRKKTFRCFPHLSELIEESGKHFPDMIANDIEKHVKRLIKPLTEYFANLQSKNNYWV